ncbi:MAG: threonine synthase [Oscillospiraceae bacterium]
MKYQSTRNAGEQVSASEAVVNGLAPDGGLYVPAKLPRFEETELRSMLGMDYCGRAELIIKKFLPEYSESEVKALVSAAYAEGYDDSATAPTRFVDEKTGFLELWHGPTCAFKDMALQMLPHLLTAALKKCGETRRICILVATSGDTGKAALEGFADVPGTKILVFYPRDGVSEVQRLQMVTQSGENVLVKAVDGNFDDAQSGVKAIFNDRAFSNSVEERGWLLSSANSINWGRLLPQIVYYFSAYCDFVNFGGIKFGEKLNFSVPTGNFGDILAGWYAKKTGLPTGRLICASNANNVLTDFIASGVYDRNRPFHTTVSPSMDILLSSNLERLLYSLCGSDSEVSGYMQTLAETGRYEISDTLRRAIAEDFSAYFCDDAETLREIRAVRDDSRYLMDTHTAVAHRALRDYRAATGDKTPAVVVSTASPFKFCDSVLSALGESTDAPGTELIERLAQISGAAIPEGIRGLAKKPIRFSDCVGKDEMRAAVEGFLA